MSKIIGSLVNLGIGKETTRGTYASATYWYPWVTLNFDDKVAKIESKEAMGNIEESHESFNSKKWGEGNIEAELRDDSLGLILYSLMGTLNSAAVAAGVVDHTFTIAQNNQHQTLCFTIDDPNGDYIFPLVAVNKFDFDFVPGELCKFSADFMSRPSRTSAGRMVNVKTENKWTANMLTFKLADTIAGLAAASEIKVQSLKLSVVKNLLPKFNIGSADVDDLINQEFQVSGEFTLPYNDTTYKTYAGANTYKCMEIKLVNNDVTIGGTYRPTLTIQLPRVSFYDWTPDRPKGTLYEQTIGFKGLRDHANSYGSIYQIVLRNLKSAY